MYKTRFKLAVAEEESKRVDTKAVPPIKGALGLQQANSSRRALGDIGNLVGALSVRCIVSKDSLQQQQGNPHVADGYVPPDEMQLDCPITRKFGANLANDYCPPAVLAQTCTREDSDPKLLHHDIPMSWRTKQRRTVGHSRAREHLAVATRKELQANMHLQPIPAHSRVKASSSGKGAVAALRKQQTLTATLTSCSEAACGGSEVEMEEAEDSLPNIDEADVGNQLAVVDYVEDIYAFYRRTEIQSCVARDYMSQQADINENMRAILVDWLIEVHLKFKLMPETLYLTMNLLDRFLACEAVLRKNLQLVGVTAMLLACKYEEIWSPEVQDFVFISDNAYTRQQILDMEKQILNKLQFNLTVPTPYVFLVRFLKAAAVSDTELEMTAFFLVELCLTQYSMMKYCPSLVAAAAVYTALQTLKRCPCWSTSLQLHSGYTEMHLRDCAAKMVKFHQHAGEGKLTVVHKKYSHPKFNYVASLEPALDVLSQESIYKGASC